MRGGNLYVALFILMVTVPILVGGAGLASFLLLRAGYGLVVGGVVPFLAMLLCTGLLGVILGRTVGRPPANESGEQPREGSTREDRADDV